MAGTLWWFWHNELIESQIKQLCIQLIYRQLFPESINDYVISLILRIEDTQTWPFETARAFFVSHSDCKAESDGSVASWALCPIQDRVNIICVYPGYICKLLWGLSGSDMELAKIAWKRHVHKCIVEIFEVVDQFIRGVWIPEGIVDIPCLFLDW